MLMFINIVDVISNIKNMIIMSHVVKEKKAFIKIFDDEQSKIIKIFKIKFTPLPSRRTMLYCLVT